MAITVPEYNQPDFGQSALAGQSVKNARIRNEVSQIGLDEKKNAISKRKEAQAIREKMEGLPNQIEELEGKGFFDEAAKLRDSYIEHGFKSIKMVEQIAPTINKNNYKQFRADLIKSGSVSPDLFPTEYDGSFFDREIKKKKGALKTLTRKWGEQGVTFSQDFMTQDGDIIWEGSKYNSDKKAGAGAGAGAGKNFSVKASDSNSIRNASANLFGGLYDPVSGKVTGVDKETAAKVASLSAEAARIYAKNQGNIPHDRAVARAARKMGISVADLSEKKEAGASSSGDPFNLR